MAALLTILLCAASPAQVDDGGVEIRWRALFLAEAYGGKMQITGGFAWKEAGNLAAVLGAALPVPIGSIVDGNPLPGTPESEKRY